MAILSLQDYIKSQVDDISFGTSGSRTSVANTLFSMFGIAGSAGTGVLAGTSTAAGVVPTDGTTGCPVITNFASGGKGYLSKINLYSSSTANFQVYDMLFKAGAYAYNANQTLSGQPVISGRCPDYDGGAVWGVGNVIILEQVTVGTLVQNVAVTYTNQNGTAGRSTGTVACPAAMIVGRSMILPLQAGDTGVQKIESVVGSVASAGTFNILICRPLFYMKCEVMSNGQQDFDALKLGMIEIYQDSAIVIFCFPPSTSTGTITLIMEIRSK